MPTALLTLARLSQALEATSSRLQRARLVADVLRGLPSDEVPAAVLLLLGRSFPERRGRALRVSGASLLEAIRAAAPAPPEVYAQAFTNTPDLGAAVRAAYEAAGARPDGPALTIPGVMAAFEALAGIAGRDSARRRQEQMCDLFRRSSPVEAQFLAKAIIGEMRHGVNEGAMLDAIAVAAGVPADLVRRANMLSGDIGGVARTALARGEQGLRGMGLRLFSPVKPMLAQTADSVAEALAEQGGEAAFEYKLDGARVQIHKQADRIAVFSRRLADVTAGLPEIAGLARGFAAQEAVVEGEVIAVDAGGRPLPFQELMRRFRRIHDIEQVRAEVPVRLYLFDLLQRGGEALIDLPYGERWERLAAMVPDDLLVARIVAHSPDEAEAFLARAIEAGHEGVMVKRLDGPYAPGVRGKFWLKVKRALTVDLVIIAADFGYGRRHGWLSNYHLAARDEATGELAMVGKTFKGLTDAEFRAMTERLLALETHRRGRTVYVQPDVVVEVAFNNIQRSRQYPSGIALRFARITRIRDDKSPTEAEALQTLREMLP